jgi:hypothetical protein
LLNAYLYGSWDDLAGSDTVIKAGWIDSCVGVNLTRINTKRVVSCDPARFGDDETVIYAFENEGVIDSQTYTQMDTMQTAGHCVVMKKKWNADLIAIDVCGLGAGVYDRLNELKENVFPIDSQVKAGDENKFANLRSEMWWYASEKFASRTCSIPDDPLLRGQLASPKYSISSDGRIKVEAKDESKKRLGRSPDRADAFIYGLWAIQFAKTLAAKKEWKTAYKPDKVKSGAWVS